MSRRLRRIGILVCLGVAAWFLSAALFPRILAPGDPFAISPADAYQAPSLAHVFGTDESGRDIYTRIVHGAADSLTIGIAATAIGLVLGVLLATVSGVGGRIGDWVSTRIVETLYAFPGILLALLLLSLTGPGILPTTIAVGLSTAPGYARLLRTQFLRVKESAYIEADRVMGRGAWFRLTRTILPNAFQPLFALATLGIGQSVVWASALSYLGLGAPPPSPEWGAMLNAGATYLSTGGWWMSVFPGSAIALVAVTGTVLGRLYNAERRQAR
ncbi:ABC transporter permease [Gulosibacter molinativorax]|uniref:ABC transporter permease n=1 Tax=Gulosibacter molinativorax TaxID=256821 RepID=A0ABT7CAF2_9MICO|nr:ABC transporter permease [Gulosibacter molinativorax]MDJ1372173.1 ABC transporter permease [Gulosibacter molinativorax]QUY60956.1 Glutathione transport system permease protein GsiD [Gulosibacter molinativorax]